MSQLSERTAAGRHDIVPGFILSPPRLREQGVAEDAFARWYIQRVDKGTRGVSHELRQAMLRAACIDVREGYFTVGMPGYDAAAQSARGGKLMFWLSLRVKHDMTYAKACELLNAGDEPAITAAVVALWGYVREDAASKETPKPIDWDPVFAAMEKRGYDADRTTDMSVGQILSILGTAGHAKNLSITDIHKVASEKQYAVFDKVCERRGITPEKLATTPPEVLVAYVREVIGDKPVDANTLTAALAEYAARKKAA